MFSIDNIVRFTAIYAVEKGLDQVLPLHSGFKSKSEPTFSSIPTKTAGRVLSLISQYTVLPNSAVLALLRQYTHTVLPSYPTTGTNRAEKRVLSGGADPDSGKYGAARAL
eukprot:3259372-Rhodomonas_salina.1